MTGTTYGVRVGTGPVRNLIRTVALALVGAISMSLTASAKAQAECMTPDACYNSAVWQKAVAKDYFNKGVWFREHSKQFFGLAYEWNQKATWYFHAGNATAAAWSKAVADDYSRKSTANARAADDHFARAAFTNTAADGNVRRGMALTAFFNPHPSAQQEANDAQAVGEDPDTTIGTVGLRRCRNPKNKEWNFAGVKMWIHPYDFCYRKPNEVQGVEVSYGNDVLGAQDVQIDDEECSHEGTWYNWRGRGPFSGRKITVTCRWVANPVGIPINVGEMICKARLYVHSDGSAAYQKINEGDPTCNINGPF